MHSTERSQLHTQQTGYNDNSYDSALIVSYQEGLALYSASRFGSKRCHWQCTIDFHGPCKASQSLFVYVELDYVMAMQNIVFVLQNHCWHCPSN